METTVLEANPFPAAAAADEDDIIIRLLLSFLGLSRNLGL
jgi:hypothetical protein